MNWLGPLALLLFGPSTTPWDGLPRFARSYWVGLDPPKLEAHARGVVVMKLPLSGRVRIPGGAFLMGATPTDMARAMAMCRHEVLHAACDNQVGPAVRWEGIAHEVTLFPFEIDRTEVTVEQYQRCVEAGACARPAFRPTDRRFDRAEFPVTHVRWDDAAQYCAWVGARLPTEAEWELAARGQLARDYPWGNVYGERLANHGAFAQDETDASDGFTGLAPVGSFPDGKTPEGVLDLAGNAAEWVADFFELQEDGFGFEATPVVNPKGPANGVSHVIRGGSYRDGSFAMRATARVATPNPQTAFVGFRCAADVR